MRGDGEVIVKAKIDTKSFDAEIHKIETQLEEIEEQIKQADMGFDVGDTAKLEAQYEKLKNRLIDLKRKKEEFAEPTNMENLQTSVNNIGNAMNGVIRKVGKWALAVFGIRSAYNLVKQSVSTLSQYDEKLASDIEYIRFSLAYALKPVIDWIIEAVYKLIALIGGLIKMVTGKNIFDNSGIDKFNSKVNGTSKSVKELKKQLAGFDEMNVLQDQSTGGGASGGATPSLDLKKMVDEFEASDIDKMFEKIGEKTTEARKGLAEYQQELWELISNPQAFDDAYGDWSGFVLGISTLWTGFVDLFAGIWDTLEGLVGMFVDIIKGDWDSLGQHWEQFTTGIGEIFMGLIEIIWGAIETVWGLIEGILINAGRWIWNNVIKPIGDWFVGLGRKIGDAFSNAWQWVKNAWNGASSFFAKLGSTILNGIKTGVKSAINWVIDKVNWLIDKITSALKIKVPNWVPSIGGKEWSVSIGRIPRLALGGIVNNPGSGVMMGNYIAGEKGAEAVIPLNDETMDRLGSAIARHMVINATMINQMNGRVLSRELKQIMNEESFASNR